MQYRAFPGIVLYLLVKVAENRVITLLNGVFMIGFTDSRPENSRGVIGFKLHPGKGGQKIRFRESWIRDLSSSD